MAASLLCISMILEKKAEESKESFEKVTFCTSGEKGPDSGKIVLLIDAGAKVKRRRGRLTGSMSLQWIPQYYEIRYMFIQTRIRQKPRTRLLCFSPSVRSSIIFPARLTGSLHHEQHILH